MNLLKTMIFTDTNMTLDSQTYSVLSKIIYSYYVVKSLCCERAKRSFFAVVRSYRLKLEILGGRVCLWRAVRGDTELVWQLKMSLVQVLRGRSLKKVIYKYIKAIGCQNSKN